MGVQENLIDTFAEFKELKNIDRSTLIGVMKEVFSSTLVKLYGEDSKFNVIVYPHGKPYVPSDEQSA